MLAICSALSTLAIDLTKADCLPHQRLQVRAERTKDTHSSCCNVSGLVGARLLTTLGAMRLPDLVEHRSVPIHVDVERIGAKQLRRLVCVPADCI